MQVELVHGLPGRVRLRLPDLRGKPQYLHALANGLRSVPGIRSVTINLWTGSLLAIFDPRQLAPTLVRRWVSEMLLGVPAAREVAATGGPGGEPHSAMATRPLGLEHREAAQRLRRFGPNVLPQQPVPPFWRRFISQFTDLPTAILILGTAFAGLAGRTTEMLAVAVAMGVNALIGAWRARHPDPALTALNAMTPHTATAIRGGTISVIPASQLVPGDVILLRSGDRVPADVVLLEAPDLEISESHLLAMDLPGPETMAEGAFVSAGSDVLRGNGRAVVVATGKSTTLGQLAGNLGTNRRLPSPVQRRTARLARDLLRIALMALAAVTGIGILRGAAPLALLQSGVSMAAASLPEGLPTYMTLALAAGARRLARRGAYVRDLGTAESVGAVSVICSDKTGTLTQGAMTVRTIFAGNAWWSVTGNGFEPVGQFRRDGEPAEPLADPDLRSFLEIAVRCNNASLTEGPDGELEVTGSQTEGALLVMAMKAGMPKEIGSEPPLRERAFDPVRRSMTMTFRLAGAQITCSKGAPETILPRCTQIIAQGTVQPISTADRAAITDAIQSLAEGGQRVLALAYADGEQKSQGFIFAGLAGIVDPPRRELRPVIRRIDRVGIRTVMLTGDHPDTAAAVARELGLLDGAKRVLTGGEVKRLDDRQLASVVPYVGVFARVTPHQKARVIRALQSRGETVAYIGDGIDDAAAIRVADVGVVPKERAAEVTRESASIILTGDRFETLVTAIEQGQGTAANTNEITRYLLTANTAEIALLLASAVFGLPLALLPLQVLWLNLIADAPVAMALAERHVPPDHRLSAGQRPVERLDQEIVVHGLEMGAASFALFITTMAAGGSLAVARTMALSAMAAGQMLYLFRCRTELGTPCGLRLPTEPGVMLAATTTGLLLLASLYFPPLATALGTVPLSMRQWLTVMGAGLAANLSAVAGFSLRREPGLPAPAL